jgi:hypothetical protein
METPDHRKPNVAAVIERHHVHKKTKADCDTCTLILALQLAQEEIVRSDLRLELCRQLATDGLPDSLPNVDSVLVPGSFHWSEAYAAVLELRLQRDGMRRNLQAIIGAVTAAGKSLLKAFGIKL